jgi:hypothetical protein
LLEEERTRREHSEGSKIRVRESKDKQTPDPMNGIDALLEEAATSRQLSSLRQKRATALKEGPADRESERAVELEQRKELMNAIQILQGADPELFQIIWERYLVATSRRRTDKSVATKIGLTEKEVRGRREKALKWLKEALKAE